MYPSTLRDLLIRIAKSGVVRAKWTEQILDETFTSLSQNPPDLDSARLRRTRDLMNAAVRDCLVTGYEPLIESLELPDPRDRHLLGAAVRARTQVIVSTTARPRLSADVLGAWDVEAKKFILDQIDLDREGGLGHRRQDSA